MCISFKFISFKLFIPIFLLSFFYTGKAQELPGIYSTSWVGNSFAPGVNNFDFMQGWANSMFVDADGTIYANCFWDEGAKEMGIYKNGKCVGEFPGQHGNADGGAITANETYVWATVNEHKVRRFLKSTKSVSGADITISTAPNPVRGLVATETELFASDFSGNLIKVYNTLTGALLRNWAVTKPGPLALDASGNVWVLSYITNSWGPGNIITCYSPTGTLLKTITLALGVQGKSFTINKLNNELYVTDIGSNMQIQIYANINTTPVFIQNFGIQGGILSDTKGLVANLKFNVPNLVGVDGNGNLIIWSNGNNPDIMKKIDADGLGTTLESYTRAGVKNWEILGLHFVDMGTFDPSSDGADFYTKHEHFTMDYTKPDGQQWSYKGFTMNRNAYPNDERMLQDGAHASTTVMQRVQGKLFMYMTSQKGDGWFIYRFDQTAQGEIAIPCGKLSQWDKLWVDTNGDGLVSAGEQNSTLNLPFHQSIWARNVDKKGTIWIADMTTGIRNYPIQSINNFGVPVYSNTSAEVIATPAPFTRLGRIVYDSDNDVMYLTGFTAALPGSDGMAGTVLARYNNWSKGNRTALYTTKLPYNFISLLNNESAASLAVEKDYIFVVGVTSRGKVWVYKAADGILAGYLIPGSNVGGVEKTGWCDLDNSVAAFKKSNGEYLVSVEEVFFMKVLVYRWNPTSTDIGVTEVKITPNSKLSLQIGENIPFTATVLPANATNKNVTWSSSNPDVASVSSTGLVTGITTGSAIIVATSVSGSVLGKAFVKVGLSFPVTHTSTPIIIDGLLSEPVWKPNNLIAKSIFGTSTNEGKFNLLWDNNYLYVGATVKDNILKPFIRGNPWNFDGVEFYLDGNQNKGATYDAFDIQIVKALGATGIFTNPTATGILSATANIAGGYSVEMAIPWSVIKATPPIAGLGLGFDIGYSDNDTGNRDAFSVWNGSGNNFSNTSAFDDLILMPPSILPLDLVSFSAKHLLNKVSLNWETKNEVNVKQIEVERSTDGINFETISIVPSKGGGFYVQQDASPLKGNNYYRLKTVDNDGKFEMSGIQVVNFSFEKTAEFLIYPNPNNGNFTISPSQSKISGTVTIFDQQGRTMLRKEILGTSNIIVDRLPKGVYLIQLNTGGLVEVKKMIKE